MFKTFHLIDAKHVTYIYSMCEGITTSPFVKKNYLEHSGIWLNVNSIGGDVT